MIRIDELAIELPAELSHRAERIARLVQEKSEGLHVDFQGRMAEIRLPDIDMETGADDDGIARAIVARLEAAFKGRG